MNGMLSPVWADTRTAELTEDDAVVHALLDVEVTWSECLAEAGHADPEDARALRDLLNERQHVPQLSGAALAREATSGGNPVIPTLAAIRSALAEKGTSAASLHLGATSQDVMDTALMLTIRHTAEQLLDDARRCCAALADLAQQHRGTVCLARTLTQHARPTSFGFRVACWLDGASSAAAELSDAVERLPLQWGGAVGTQAALTETIDPAAAAELTSSLAARLGLRNPDLPWHVQRQPVLRLASALAAMVAALGKPAADVLTLQRPEIAELTEPSAAGRGGSSSMPQKQNPVLSVLIRSAALQAPGHLANLHHSASVSVDERPDGAWHAEWPAVRELLRLAGGAAARSADLFQGLRVDQERMQDNIRAAGDALFSEQLVTALQSVHPQGRTGIQATIREAVAAGDNLVARLRSQIPAEAIPEKQLDAVLTEALDPQRALGRAEEFIDAALTAYQKGQ